MQQISFGQSVRCPTFVSDSQPEKHFTLGRGPRFPDALPWLKSDWPIKESPICWSGGENSRALKSPTVWVFGCGQQEILLMSHNWKYSDSPIMDRPPSTSLGQQCSWKASAIDLFKNFRGTAENTLGAMSLMQHPKSHLSVQKKVLFPLWVIFYVTIYRGVPLKDDASFNRFLKANP